MTSSLENLIHQKKQIEQAIGQFVLDRIKKICTKLNLSADCSMGSLSFTTKNGIHLYEGDIFLERNLPASKSFIPEKEDFLKQIKFFTQADVEQELIDQLDLEESLARKELTRALFDLYFQLRKEYQENCPLSKLCPYFNFKAPL